MKKFFLLFLLYSFVLTYCQDNKKKFRLEYINMSSLSITKNTESYFTNYSKDSIKTFDGLGFDLNTIHGAKFFGHISLSAGVSLDWNINKSFLSAPIIFDFRVFSSKNTKNSLFCIFANWSKYKMVK